jgi:pilus assembly protein Flp/PilA
MKNLVARLVREDRGQDLIEYGLLIGIITTGVVGVISQLGPVVKDYYDNLLTELQGPGA